jgi:hypothetical protein
MLSKIMIFSGIPEKMLQILLDKYIEDIFLENESTLYIPDDRYESFYIIFNGNIDYCSKTKYLHKYIAYLLIWFKQ